MNDEYKNSDLANKWLLRAAPDLSVFDMIEKNIYNGTITFDSDGISNKGLFYKECNGSDVYIPASFRRAMFKIIPTTNNNTNNAISISDSDNRDFWKKFSIGGITYLVLIRESFLADPDEIKIENCNTIIGVCF